MRTRYIAVLIGVGFVTFASLGADVFRGALLSALTGTTTDPRALGLRQSASMTLTRATLRTDVLMDTPAAAKLSNRLIPGDYRLTFEAPNAYYSAIGKPSAERGIQAIAFSFWSKTGDPVGPDLIADSQLCGRQAHACAGSPLRKRQDAGEWQVEVEMFNAVDTPAERYRWGVGQLDRARGSQEACAIYEDAQLGMTVVTVPVEQYPRPIDGYIKNPKFCGGVYSDSGSVVAQRGLPPQYFPPRFFYKFDAQGNLVFRVSCRVFIPPGLPIRPLLCTMGIDFGNWNGRVWLSPLHIAEWEQAHTDIMTFLARHVVARTPD